MLWAVFHYYANYGSVALHQGKAMSYQLPPFTQWEKDWVKIGFLVFLKNIMLKQLRILPKWLLDVKFDLGLCFELPRSLEAAEAIRGRGQIWHPEVRASHLSIIYGGPASRPYDHFLNPRPLEAALVTSQNRGWGQIWHPKVIWVESWVVLTLIEK